MKETWQLDDKFRQEFLDFCSLAAHDNVAFSSFKRNDRVCTIIQNSNEDWMRKAFKILSSTEFVMEKHWFKFQENDQLGSPVIYGLGKNMIGSPTNVRYIYTLYLLRKLLGLGSKKFCCDHIIEIGAGYGGQCKVIYDFCDYIPIIDYTIFDLKEVTQLQRKYLSKFGIRPNFYNNLDIEIQDNTVDLVISWCAWSELDYVTRVEYFEKVISKAKHFLICSNYNAPEDFKILTSTGLKVKEYSDSLYQSVFYI